MGQVYLGEGGEHDVSVVPWQFYVICPLYIPSIQMPVCRPQCPQRRSIKVGVGVCIWVSGSRCGEITPKHDTPCAPYTINPLRSPHESQYGCIKVQRLVIRRNRKCLPRIMWKISHTKVEHEVAFFLSFRCHLEN